MGKKNINVVNKRSSLKIEASNKPWITEVNFNLEKNLITINLVTDDKGNTEILCLEPDPIKEKFCSLSSGYRSKKGKYFSEGKTAEIPDPFNYFLFPIQFLVASLPIKE